MTTPVSSPEEIDGQFDVISYQKGASIIRMMADFLGEETFRRGIVRYLKDRYKTQCKVWSMEHELEGGVISRTDNSCCS